MSKIIAVNTTGRTKAQIVAEAEATWLLPHLVGDLGCGADCRCIKCYHKTAHISIKEMLAKVSKDLKGGIHDSPLSVVRCPDGNVVQADAGADEARMS